MANPLVKFARGAAGAGAALYADRYQQDVHADIMAKRDAVLNKYRTESQESAQSFATKEREAGQEFRASESEKDRTARAEDKPDNAREVTKLAAPVARDLFKAQSERAIEEGDPEYRSYEQLLRQVTESITSVEGGAGDEGGTSGPSASGAGGTEGGFIKGQIYLDPQGNEFKYLGGDPNKRSSYEAVGEKPSAAQQKSSSVEQAAPEPLEGDPTKSFGALTTIIKNIQTSLEKGSGSKELLSKALDQAEADMQARLKYLKQARKRRQAAGLNMNDEEIVALEDYLSSDSLIVGR